MRSSDLWFPGVWEPTSASFTEGRPPATLLRRERAYRRSLAVADVLAVVVTLLGCAALFDFGLTAWALLVLPVVVVTSKVAGLYDRDEHLLHKTTLDEEPQLFQVATLFAFVMWLGSGTMVTGAFGRVEALALWLALSVLFPVMRIAARKVAQRLAGTERCLIVGDGASADSLARRLHTTHTLDAEVVGRVPVPDDRRQVPGSVPQLGALSELGSIIEEHSVDRVIVVPHGPDSTAVLDTIRYVKASGVKVSVLPSLFEVIGSSVKFDSVDGMTVLGVPRYGLSRSSANLKRAFDMIGSLAAILVLAPLMALIALAIKLTSPGPILFRQTRIGCEGSQFELLKFRTMFDGADQMKQELRALNETEGLFKLTDDPRVTRVGRVLRRTALDELPQLFNVLRGEMSLVGPRPLVVDEDQRVQGWHRRRLALKPGITGVWQILSSGRIPLRDMVKIDYLYAGNWSLWLDIKTLLRTVPYVLSRRGL